MDHCGLILCFAHRHFVVMTYYKFQFNLIITLLKFGSPDCNGQCKALEVKTVLLQHILGLSVTLMPVLISSFKEINHIKPNKSS